MNPDLLILAGFGILLAAYLLYRRRFGNKLEEDVNKEIQEILHSDAHKVKGRFEQ